MKLREIALTPPIVAIIISFGLMFDASATDRYVSADKDYGSGPNGEVKDGDLLYDTIQSAITAAKAGETVWVKDGFVCETGGTSTKKNGFVCRVVIDKAITLRSQSGEGRSGNPPIIKGDWANPDATCMDEAVGSGARRPLYVSVAATVLGFVIERGAAHTLNSDYSDYGGGGISGKLGTIEKCVIRNCYSGYGGGVHSPASSTERLTLVDCVISNNVAQYRGDGAWGALTLKNCLVSGNGYDPNTAKKKGSGGVSGKSDTFRIWVEGCVISNNTTVGSGGGATWAKISKGSRIVGNTASTSGGGANSSILNDSEVCLNKVTNTHSSGGAGGGLLSCVATNCVISGNVAQIGGGVSGGTTVNCYLANNKSRGHGGGVCLTSTANLCVGCTVVSNTAVQWGGGLYTTADRASFYNCLVAWNEQGADDGIGASGACGEWSSTGGAGKYARLVNCTVVSNRLSGTHSCGGTYQCELVNTIVWGNVRDNGKASNLASTRSAVNSCAPELSDTTKYPGCTAANPKFRRGCVYQIGPRSPCRETGAILTDDAVFSSMQTDIDGNPRFGEKDGEPTIDMGCCQYAPFGLMMLVK